MCLYLQITFCQVGALYTPAHDSDDIIISGKASCGGYFHSVSFTIFIILVKPTPSTAFIAFFFVFAKISLSAYNMFMTSTTPGYVSPYLKSPI